MLIGKALFFIVLLDRLKKRESIRFTEHSQSLLLLLVFLLIQI